MISRDGVFNTTSTTGQIFVTSDEVHYAVIFLIFLVFLSFVIIFYPRFILSMKLTL